MERLSLEKATFRLPANLDCATLDTSQYSILVGGNLNGNLFALNIEHRDFRELFLGNIKYSRHYTPVLSTRCG